MFENASFKLNVPLDASQIKERKPEHAVKVAAYPVHGPAQEQIVRFDRDGKASASFHFQENPGAVKVIVGPEKATIDDLQHLQTISVTVPAARDRREIAASPIVISRYYWDWWIIWCRRFTITGRVLCPDGSPVVGAVVSAFDVDAWWWWLSKELVGTNTTQADGSFEIDFTECCGWWPWWWWELRDWVIDPYLVDRIQNILKSDPRIKGIPRPSPAPSLAIFDQLMASAAPGPRGGPVARQALKTNVPNVSAAIDPAALEPLRNRLLEVLPKEFNLPIWPWYPWWPWWDCGANIIFQVTQNCSGQVNTIVNETFADTRWNVPFNLNVTLTANSQACCAYGCNNPSDCPEGDCLNPTDICQINVGSIGGNIGSVSTPAQIGLVSPGVQDRPFAGAVSFYGRFGTSANVDYYEFQYSTTGAPGSYNPLPIAAVAGFSRQTLVVNPGPTFTWVPVPFNPALISDGAINHYVTETIQHYEAINGAQTWDSISHDLLEVLNTANVLPNGTYYLQLVGYQRPGTSGNLTNPTVLPICDNNPDDPAVLNYWVVTLDNQAPGNTDPTGQPCGLHICTDQPTSDILQVMIQHGDGSTSMVEGCGLVCVSPGDSLVVDFVAYDPDSFLASYNLELLYGVDQSVQLLGLGTPVASPLAPPWAPAPPAGPNSPHQTLVGPGYANALAQGAASPVWAGGAMRLTVNATDAFPELPCAYLMQLNVSKRPIVNCDAINDEQSNVSFQSFTVQACPVLK